MDEGVISKQSNGKDVDGIVCGTMKPEKLGKQEKQQLEDLCFKPGPPEGEAGVLPTSTRQRTCGGQCIYGALAKELIL